MSQEMEHASTNFIEAIINNAKCFIKIILDEKTEKGCTNNRSRLFDTAPKGYFMYEYL